MYSRFYGCFESIERYGTDLIQFVDDLEEGKFIQQNLGITFYIQSSYKYK